MKLRELQGVLFCACKVSICYHGDDVIFDGWKGDIPEKYLSNEIEHCFPIEKCNTIVLAIILLRKI